MHWISLGESPLEVEIGEIIILILDYRGMVDLHGVGVTCQCHVAKADTFNYTLDCSTDSHPHQEIVRT